MKYEEVLSILKRHYGIYNNILSTKVYINANSPISNIYLYNYSPESSTSNISNANPAIESLVRTQYLHTDKTNYKIINI